MQDILASNVQKIREFFEDYRGGACTYCSYKINGAVTSLQIIVPSVLCATDS